MILFVPTSTLIMMTPIMFMRTTQITISTESMTTTVIVDETTKQKNHTIL